MQNFVYINLYLTHNKAKQFFSHPFNPLIDFLFRSPQTLIAQWLFSLKYVLSIALGKVCKWTDRNTQEISLLIILFYVWKISEKNIH